MCSIQIQGPPRPDTTDHEGWAGLAAARSAAGRRPWGRFVRVFGDEDDKRVPGDEELLRALADAEGLVTQLMARQSEILLELRRRRRHEQQQVSPDGHDPDCCTLACCDPDGWIGLEVAQALGVTERQVEHRLSTAERLTRYRHVRVAVGDGLLQVWTASKLLEHLDALSPYLSADRLERVQQATVAWLLDRPRTVGQLNTRMRRLLLRARSSAGADPAERDAAASRQLSLTPAGADGLSTVVAHLPEQDAIALRAALTALARDPSDPADPRTEVQRRCDLLTCLVTGVPAAYGRPDDLELLVRDPGEIVAQVQITIPADALTGAHAPADVPGYGAVPAAAARAMVSGWSATGRPLVYDPRSGRLLGLGSPSRMSWLADVQPAGGYRHPPAMQRLVRVRDATCRAPGCSRPAVRCDLDHVLPFPGGVTSLDNCCCLCRRHHRLKTHAPGWRVSLDSDASVTWTTPTGRILQTDPYDYAWGAESSIGGVVDADGDPAPF